MELKWTELAVSDLNQIEAYITRKNSAEVAVDVVLGVIDTVETVLPDHPQAGRSGRVENTRELVIDKFPFVIIYRLASTLNQIQVLRILHEAQDWPDSNL